jgi:hypothetical protein
VVSDVLVHLIQGERLAAEEQAILEPVLANFSYVVRVIFAQNTSAHLEIVGARYLLVLTNSQMSRHVAPADHGLAVFILAGNGEFKHEASDWNVGL